MNDEMSRIFSVLFIFDTCFHILRDIWGIAKSSLLIRAFL